MVTVLIGSLVLGVVAGLRTLTAPAALYLARGGVAGYVLAVAALAELVVDMLPATPPRTAPLALIGRIVSGAVVGWMLCAWHGASPFAGAVAGVLGALIGTYGGKAARLWLITRAGAVPAALIEDVVAIGLAIAVVTGIGPP
jgi:uncharacterized membrane protein